MKRNLMDGLNRWNQKDKQGMLLSGTVLLFGILLPLLIYGISDFAMFKSSVPSTVALIYQIRDILIVLSFTAFYSALFTAILNYVSFWKNLLCVLAPFAAETIHDLILNWQALGESIKDNPNADTFRAFFFVGVLSYLLKPLLWTAIAYVVRLIPWGKKWNLVILMILMALWRTVPHIVDSKKLAMDFFQSQWTYIFLSCVVGAIVFFIGYKLFQMIDRELNAPAKEDWAHK